MAQEPPELFVEFARFVDQAGFSHLFVADSSLHARDVYPYLTLAALNTTAVRLGPLVTHPYTRHPAVNLNALVTVNEIAGGRIIVNIGAGDRPVLELGYPMARVGVVRQAIQVMRGLLSGEALDFQGEAFSLQQASLRYGRPDRVPLYVTASGPRMLELGGELADGVLFLSGTDPRCVRYALDRIAAGARRAGRTLEDLFLGCCVYGALDDDVAAARDTCRPIAAWFPQTAPHYADLVGIPPERVAAIRQVYSGGHFDESRAALEMADDPMVDAFAMAGDAGMWCRRLRAIEALGVNLIVIYPMVADRFGMIRRLAADVLPHFRP